MTFRILSLDGGGTWALIEAMALGDLYPGETGHQILSHFDLATANSGGSIVLGGLMLVIALVMALTFLTLLMSERVSRLLGVTGNSVLTRMFGLVLAAMAVRRWVEYPCQQAIGAWWRRRRAMQKEERERLAMAA